MKNSEALSRNQKRPGTQVKGANGNGGSQPPRNRIVVSAHMVVRWRLLAEEEQQGRRGEYSRRKPATSSIPPRPGRTAAVGLGQRRDEEDDEHRKQRQPEPVEAGRAPPSCALTISVRLSEPTHSSTVMITKPIETS